MAMMVQISHQIQPHDEYLQFQGKSNKNFIHSWFKTKNNGKREGTHHIGNTIKLKKLNWTHYKPQSNKQCQHSSPTSCGSNYIFSFIWTKQVTARVKVRTSLPRTSSPLNSNTNNHQTMSILLPRPRVFNVQIMVKACRHNTTYKVDRICK